MTIPNPPPTPAAPADAGTPPDPMRDVPGRARELLDAVADFSRDEGAHDGLPTQPKDRVKANEARVQLVAIIDSLAARLASAERERDALREEVREFELNENCRAKG